VGLHRWGSGLVSDILVGGATVAIVAVTEDEQVVLARQYRPGPGRVLLELPGGNADGDEPVEVAAARELLEETGYEAATLEVVMQTFLSSYASHRRHAVLARGCRKVAEPRLDDAEFIETVLMPVGVHPARAQRADDRHRRRLRGAGRRRIPEAGHVTVLTHC
jgi:ADP-ribose pyrophosphatase